MKMLVEYLKTHSSLLMERLEWEYKLHYIAEAGKHFMPILHTGFQKHANVLRVPGLYLNLTEICLYPQLSAHDSSLAHLYVLADF